VSGSQQQRGKHTLQATFLAIQVDKCNILHDYFLIIVEYDERRKM
jgi:hypothetical protein